MLILVCQLGIGYWVLMPPPLPMPFPQFQTVSKTRAPPGPVVVKVVPPTCVMNGESPGSFDLSGISIVVA